MPRFKAGPFRENWAWGWYPPSPLPLERLDWRGVCKNGLQNLEPQGVAGQNLDNKELASFLGGLACTAIALTMICFLPVEVKVGRHTICVRAVGIPDAWPRRTAKPRRTQRTRRPAGDPAVAFSPLAKIRFGGVGCRLSGLFLLRQFKPRAGKEIPSEGLHANGGHDNAPCREEQPSGVEQIRIIHRRGFPLWTARGEREQISSASRRGQRTLLRRVLPPQDYCSSGGAGGACCICFCMRASRLASNSFILACWSGVSTWNSSL